MAGFSFTGHQIFLSGGFFIYYKEGEREMGNKLLGNIVDILGTAANLKERGWSERLAGGTPTVNTGLTEESKQAGLDEWANYHFDDNTSQQQQPQQQQPQPQTSGYRAPAQTSGGGGFDKKDPNANPGEGWFWDAASGWKPKSGGTPGGYQAPSGPSQAEINAAFAPSFQSLDRAQNLQSGFYQENRAGLEADKKRQLEQLEAAQLESDDLLQEQKLKLSNEKISALNQAIRAFKGLSQGAANRYGQRSGSGQMLQNLAQREFARQQGGVRQKYATQLGEWQDSVRQTEKFYVQTEQEIDSKYRDAFKGLMQDYQSALTNIRMRRDELESAKRQYRLEAKQRVKDLTAQLMNKRQEELNSLSSWKEQVNYKLQAELRNTQSNLYQKPQDTFDDFDTKLEVNEEGQVLTPYQQALARKRAQNNEEDDELQELGQYFSFTA